MRFFWKIGGGLLFWGHPVYKSWCDAIVTWRDVSCPLNIQQQVRQINSTTLF